MLYFQFLHYIVTCSLRCPCFSPPPKATGCALGLPSGLLVPLFIGDSQSLLPYLFAVFPLWNQKSLLSYRFPIRAIEWKCMVCDWLYITNLKSTSPTILSLHTNDRATIIHVRETLTAPPTWFPKWEVPRMTSKKSYNWHHRSNYYILTPNKTLSRVSFAKCTLCA